MDVSFSKNSKNEGMLLKYIVVCLGEKIWLLSSFIKYLDKSMLGFFFIIVIWVKNEDMGIRGNSGRLYYLEGKLKLVNYS